MKNPLFPSLETVTVHQLSGRELNAAILAATGHEIDPVSNGEVMGDDSSGMMEVTVDPNDADDDYVMKEYLKFKETGKAGVASRIIHGFLRELAVEGKMPFGTYQIEYTWG